MYIYIYAVKLKSGPRFGGFKVKKWSKFKVKKWSKFFFTVFPIFIVFWGHFRNTNSATVCQNSVFAKFGGCQKWGFRKENCIFCFFLFCVGKIETEKGNKEKMEKAKKPDKNKVFLRWASKNVKKPKKWIFSKNCLTRFASGREKKNAHFRAHYLFWPKLFWDQNSVNQEKL